MNDAAHAVESGSAPPAVPILFFKTPNTVVGPNDDIRIPRGSTKADWEVVLAVVIGRRARYLLSVDDAATHIAGYTVSNDVSEREFQLELSLRFKGRRANAARASIHSARRWLLRTS